MTVYLVGAGPGDPGLLTRRGAALLARADVVVHDRLVDPSLLSLAQPGAEIVDVGKQPGGNAGAAGQPGGDPDAEGAARQEAINDLLVRRARAGLTVVRLKGGDPFLFGRGGEEAQALSAAGVAWEVVPGVSSALSVPEAAGIPVTFRGLSASVTVVTGRVGEPSGPGAVDWESLGRAGGTLVVLMGMATRAEIAGRLMAAGRSADTPVAVVQWGTTAAQRTRRTTLAELHAVDLGSPAVIVIGEVAGLRLEPGGGATGAGHEGFDDGHREARRPLLGRTVVVTRSGPGADAWATALEAAGARVVQVPVEEVVDPADGEALGAAAARVGRFDWVAFTSAHAVHRLLAHLRDARAFGGARVAAVGPATAAALAEHGIVADLVPEERGQPSSGAGLAAAMGPAPPAGGTVLFPRAKAARPDLPDGLRRRGWTVEEVETYRTAPAPPPGPAVAHEVSAADAIVFAAPSAVRGWLALQDSAGRSLPVPPAVVCIGAVTAQAAAANGLTVSATAARPSAAGVVEALASLAPPAAGAEAGPWPGW